MKQANSTPAFGAYIIGDEILSGKRQDAHLTAVIQALKSRGLALGWAHYLGDDPAQITSALKTSMARGDIALCFGGIGATPDDHTRQAAAEAAGVPIARHAAAEAEIIARFGDGAYPKRVLMADFPAGADLIPNPVNRVAGFSICQHYFMPGFPEMAHPMMEWVLDTHYAHLFHCRDHTEASILVIDGAESQLIDLMQQVMLRYPDIKIFSLPRLAPQRCIELGAKGPATSVEYAMQLLRDGVTQVGYHWHSLP